jgi:Fe-S cluster assembly ATP-binding protein
VEKRVQKGIFLSFQQPLSLSGVNVFQLLRLALSGKKDPLALKKEIETLAKKLKIKKELIERSLNDGASGGEKKKMEVLQAAVLEPKFLIFDEVDTGVDVDALKTIASFIADFKKGRTILLITHYNRILRYLRPDKVLVMIDGEIKKVGDHQLAEEIERNGYLK